MSEPLEHLQRIASGFMEAKILLVAAQLRLFDRLREGGATAERIAADWGAAPRGVGILLDALVAMGLLAKDGTCYANVPAYEPFLVEDGPTHTVAALRHRNRLFRHWAFLEETILGQPRPAFPADRGSLEDPQQNEDFIRAMYAGTHARVGAVLDLVDLGEAQTVADVGGGPGHYLAEMLRRRPQAQGFLVDLPLTLAVARRVQAEDPVGERITFVAWDFYAEGPPPRLPPVDLMWLSQVVHAESPEANQALFSRLAPLLGPGGRLVVQEHVLDPSRTAPREGALFAVNMLAMTPAGRAYTEAEITAWAEAAGLVPGASRRLDGRSHVLVYERPPST